MNKIKKRFKRDAKRILGNWLYIDKNREILPIWIEFYFWDKNNHKDEKACHIIDNDDYKKFKKEYCCNRYRKHKIGFGGYDINLSKKFKKEYYSCLLKLCILHNCKNNSYSILTQINLKKKLGDKFDKKKIKKTRKQENIKPKTAVRIGVTKGLVNAKRAYYTSTHEYRYYYNSKYKRRICLKSLKEEFGI